MTTGYPIINPDGTLNRHIYFSGKDVDKAVRLVITAYNSNKGDINRTVDHINNSYINNNITACYKDELNAIIVKDNNLTHIHLW